MKKYLLSLGILALLASCGGEESASENGENSENQTEEVVEEVTEAPADLTISSWELLTSFRYRKEAYIDSLRGMELEITDIVIKRGSYRSMTGMGYDGTNFMGYSKSGKVDVIDGVTMPEFDEYPAVFMINRPEADESNEIIESETTEGKTPEGLRLETRTYHTIINLRVNGDNFEVLDDTNIKVNDAKITAHKNV